MSQFDDTSDMSSDTGIQESFEQVQGGVSGGLYSVDDEDQPGAEDFMLDRGLDDPLDEGYSPPE